MRSIANLFAAFSNLAASINSLAGLVDAASGRLRMQLASEVDPPVLAHDEALDNSTPVDMPLTAGKHRGRARASAPAE